MPGNIFPSRIPFLTTLAFSRSSLFRSSHAFRVVPSVAAIPLGLWRVRLRRQDVDGRDRDLRIHTYHRRFHRGEVRTSYYSSTK